MKYIIRISICIFIILSFNEMYSYRWPIEQFDEQKVIAGTVGEPRGPNGGVAPFNRYHNGQDIAGIDGTPVYHVYPNSFTVTEAAYRNVTWTILGTPDFAPNHTSYVGINRFYYVHIKPDPDLFDNAHNFIGSNDPIATFETPNSSFGTIYYPNGQHLHFYERFRNSLGDLDQNNHDHELFSYIDHSQPMFHSTDPVRFYKAEFKIPNDETSSFEKYLDCGENIFTSRLSDSDGDNVNIRLNDCEEREIDPLHDGLEKVYKIYGKIDAVANVRDYRTGTTEHNDAVYLYGYELWQLNNGNWYFIQEQKTFMDSIPNWDDVYQNYQYYSLKYNIQNNYYSYLLCNDIFNLNNGNQYLNTRQDMMQSYTISAKRNSDSKYKDGLYIFKSLAGDIDNNVRKTVVINNGLNRTILEDAVFPGYQHSVENSQYILVDNFAPYVEQVVIKKVNGEELYNCEYVLNSTGELEKHYNTTKILTEQPGDVTIEITFSEKMSADISDCPVVLIKGLNANGGAIWSDAQVSGAYTTTDHKVWRGNASIPVVNGQLAFLKLSVANAKDLAHNVLDIDLDKQVPASRDDSGNFNTSLYNPNSGGEDLNHVLLYSVAPELLAVGIEQNGQGVYAVKWSSWINNGGGRKYAGYVKLLASSDSANKSFNMQVALNRESQYPIKVTFYDQNNNPVIYKNLVKLGFSTPNKSLIDAFQADGQSVGNNVIYEINFTSEEAKTLITKGSTYFVVSADGMDNNPETLPAYNGISIQNFENQGEAKKYPVIFNKSNPSLTVVSVYNDKGTKVGDWSKGSLILKDLKAGKYKLKVEVKDLSISSPEIKAYLIPINANNYGSKIANQIDTFGKNGGYIAWIDIGRLIQNEDQYYGYSIVDNSDWANNHILKLQNNWVRESEFTVGEGDRIPEGNYTIALAIADNVYKPVEVVLGMQTKKNNGMLYIADDQNNTTIKGGLVSSNFNLDYTPPEFEFNISALLQGLVSGMIDAIKLQLTEKLSRSVHVVISSKNRDDGSEMLRCEYIINGVDTLINGTPNITIEEVQGIPGMKLAYKNNEFVVEWDVWQFLINSGKLASGLNGYFTVSAEDDAGNTWSDGVKFDLQKQFQDAAKNAILNALGISDKTLIIAPGFSAGGIEIDPAKYILIGMGINGKSICITPGDESDGGTTAVNKIIKSIKDYSEANGGGKIVVSTWGKTGIWLKQALLDRSDLKEKVSKIVNIGVPEFGQNSISMAPQSYSGYLTIAPIISLLNMLKLEISGKEVSVNQLIAQITGFDLEGMTADVVRNSDVVNPMNIISILLGRANSALTIDANSAVMAKLRNFKPEDLGIAVTSVKTAFWPDMPLILQLGVSVASGAAAYFGAYNNVPAYSMKTKIFNSLDEDLAGIAADYTEEVLNRYVYNPLWLTLETEIRRISENSFNALDNELKAVVQRALGANVDIKDVETKVTEIRTTIASIRRFTPSTPKELRTQTFTKLAKQMMGLPYLSEGYANFAAFYRAQFSEINSKINSTAGEILKATGGVEAYVDEAQKWINGDNIEKYVSEALSKGQPPDWIKQVMPNYESMIASMVKEIYNQVISYAFDEIGKQIGVKDLEGELKGYLDTASTTLDMINGNINTIKTISDKIATIADNDNLAGFIGELGSPAELTTNAQFEAAVDFLDTFAIIMQGDSAALIGNVVKSISGSLSSTNATNDAAGFNVSDIINKTENTRDLPVVLTKSLYDRGTSFLTASAKELIKTATRNLINTLIPASVRNFEITISIPPGPVGAVIMAAVSFMATDYLKNTDLKSEGGKLLISKIFGLPGGQSLGNQVSTSFKDMAGDADRTLTMVGGEKIPVVLMKLNGKNIPSFRYSEEDYGIETLFSVQEKSDGTQVPDIRKVGSIQVNEFINSIEGILRGSLPKMGKLMVSVNYSDFRDLEIGPNGNFKMTGIRLLEGRNVICFATVSSYKGRDSANHIVGSPGYYPFEIYLDMLSIQTFPVWPRLNEVVNLSNYVNPEIAVGIYKAGMGSSLTTNNLNVKIRRLAIPWTNEVISNYYDTWTEIKPDEYRLEQNDEDSLKLSFRLRETNGGIPEGQYAVKMETIDSVGNRSVSVMGFYNDTTPPKADIQDIPFVNSAGSLLVSYKWHDAPLPSLKSAEVRVDGNLVKIDALRSTGIDYFSTNGYYPSDGVHTVTLSAVDRADNRAEFSRSFYVDKTPPSFTNIYSSMKGVMNANTNTFGIVYKLTDPENGISSNEAYFRVILENKNTAKRYYSGSLVEKSLFGTALTNNWSFYDPFQKVVDGDYYVHISAADMAGNEAEEEIEEVTVDRTAPVVYEAYAMPYIMASNNAKTTVYYKLSEDDDYSGNRGPVDVSIVIVEKYTAQVVETFENSMSNTDGSENKLVWNGKTNGVELPKGTYDFIITAKDKNGNETARYVEVVKGGIPPQITSPKLFKDFALSSVEVKGNVGISGIAKDPVWDNRQNFLNYALYIKSGLQEIPEILDHADLTEFENWSNASGALWVPELNRRSGSDINVSYRPVENDSLLGYLETGKLANGDYTLLLVTREENGSELVAGTGDPDLGVVPGCQSADIAYIRITNTQDGQITGSDGTPLVNLIVESVNPMNFEAKGNNKMETKYRLTLKNVPEGDVSFGVYDQDGNNKYNEKRFGVNGKDYIKNTSGIGLGYIVYQTNDGWHIRITNTGTNSVRFSGHVRVNGRLDSLEDNPDPLTDHGIVYNTMNEFNFSYYVASGTRSWKTTNEANERITTNVTIQNGRDIHFNAVGDKIWMELLTDDEIDTNVIYIDNGHPVIEPLFGPDNVYATNIASLSSIKGFWLDNPKPVEPFYWDGRDLFGSLVDEGAYTLVLTAEGRNGKGFDKEIISNVNVTSVLSITDVSLSATNFNPFSTDINSTTLRFRVTKRAFVDVQVVNSYGDIQCVIATNVELLGNNLNEVTYNGAKDFMGSSEILSNGSYRFRIIARDADHAGSMETGSSDFFYINPNENVDPGLFASLNVEGSSTNKDGTVAVNGDGRFYWTLNNVKGRYLPPMKVTYKVRLKGTQTVVGYPFVPFVTKAYRWFEKVYVDFTPYLHYRLDYIRAKHWFASEWDWEDVNGVEYDYYSSPFTHEVLKPGDAFSATLKVSVSDPGPSASEAHTVVWPSGPYNSGLLVNGKSVSFLPDEYTFTALGTDQGGTIFHLPYQWVSGSYFFQLDPKHRKKSTVNNCVNRFSQWASENKFYYKNPDNNNMLDPHIETTNDGQDSIYTNLNYFVSEGYITNDSGELEHYFWTNSGKNGYVSRIYSLTNDFEQNRIEGHALNYEYDNFVNPQYRSVDNVYFELKTNNIARINNRLNVITTVTDIVSLFSTNSETGNVTEKIVTNFKTEVRVTNYSEDINSAYNVSFREVISGSKKFVAETGLYNFDHTLPFPATIRMISNKNAANDFAGSLNGFDKYRADRNNIYIDPKDSYVNYGGERVSWVTNSTVLYMSQKDGNYYFRSAGYLTNFDLVTRGKGITNININWMPPVPEEFRNISPENLEIEILSVEPLDPHYASNPEYTNTNSVKMTADINEQAGTISYSGHTFDDSWFISQDENLVGDEGVLKSGTNIINGKEFNGKPKDVYFTDAYLKNGQTISNNSLFWITNGVVFNNPWLYIDTETINTSNIQLFYLNGQKNDDLYVTNVSAVSPTNAVISSFQVALKPGLDGRKIAEIKGMVNSCYELSYFNGKDYTSITNVYVAKIMTEPGPIAYWNITGLSGRYTLILKVYNTKGAKYISQTVDIGEYSRTNSESGNFLTSSPYKRAEVVFSAGFAASNTLVNVTAKKLNEMDADEFGGKIPDIAPIGPILKMEPSPCDFGTNTADWPTITMKYTFNEANQFGLINSTPAIYTVTKNGIEMLNTTVLYLTYGENGDKQTSATNPGTFSILQLTAAASHFSTFFVLSNTNYSLPAPEITRNMLSLAIITNNLSSGTLDRQDMQIYYSTKEKKISVTGRAGKGPGIPQFVQGFVDVDEYLHNETEAVLSASNKISGDAGFLTNITYDTNNRIILKTNEAGWFVLSNISLNEGTNFVTVKYSIDNSPIDRIIVILDSIGSKIIAFDATEAMSPNDDGKKDLFSASYVLNAASDSRFEVYDREGNVLFGSLTEKTASNTIYWKGTNSQGLILADGLYDYRFTAIDRLGNVNDSLVRAVKIDTVMPSLTVDALSYLINSANTASVIYKCTEPVVVKTALYNSAGLLVNEFAGSGYIPEGTLNISGSDSNLNSLADGSYTLRINYEDAAGNDGIPLNIKVIVDRTPPSITVPSATPDHFIAGKNKTVIGFFTSEDGVATLKLRKTNGTQVNYGTITNNMPAYTGMNEFEFNGLVNGKAIPLGSYEMTLTVKDQNGNVAGPKYCGFENISDDKEPVVVLFTLSTNRLGYKSGRVGLITIKYCVTDNVTVYNSETVSEFMPYVRIVNSAGTLISKLTPFLPGATNEVYWHGKDDNGTNVPDGLYFAVLDVKDEAGNKLRVDPFKDILVDNKAPLIVAFNVSNTSISPENSSAKQKAGLRLKIYDDDLAYASVDVGMGGVSFRQIYNGFLSNNIEHSFEWNGKLDDGEAAAEGTYDVFVKLMDNSGNETVESKNLTVDRSVPIAIIPLEILNDPFSPNNDGSRDYLPMVTMATDNLSAEMELRFIITPKTGGQPVREWTETVRSGDINTNYWDGRNSSGSIVPDGSYRIQAYFADNAGNESVLMENEAEIDTTPPSLPDVTVRNPLFSPNVDTFMDTSVISNTVKADEKVWVTHNIEGDTVNYGYNARGLGIYYPETNVTVTLSAYGVQTNYVTSNGNMTFTVEGGKQSVVSYPKVSAEWSAEIEKRYTNSIYHDVSLTNIGLFNYIGDMEYIFYVPNAIHETFRYSAYILNFIGTVSTETKWDGDNYIVIAHASSPFSFPASVTIAVSGTTNISLISSSAEINCFDGETNIGIIEDVTNGINLLRSFSGYIKNGTVWTDGTNVFARTQYKEKTTKDWNTSTNGLYAEYYYNNNLDSLISDEFSMSMWVKANSLGTIASCLSDIYGTPKGWELETTGANYNFKISDNNGTFGEMISVPVTNEYHHVVLTYSKVTKRASLWVNGQYSSLFFPFEGVINNNDYIHFGFKESKYPAFQGAIDDIRIYNRVLNPQEVSNIHLYEGVNNGLINLNGQLAYFPFNGDDKDESGNLYKMINNTAELTNDRFNNPNSAYYLNTVPMGANNNMSLLKSSKYLDLRMVNNTSNNIFLSNFGPNYFNYSVYTNVIIKNDYSTRFSGYMKFDQIGLYIISSTVPIYFSGIRNDPQYGGMIFYHNDNTNKLVPIYIEYSNAGNNYELTMSGPTSSSMVISNDMFMTSPMTAYHVDNLDIFNVKAVGRLSDYVSIPFDVLTNGPVSINIGSDPYMIVRASLNSNLHFINDGVNRVDNIGSMSDLTNWFVYTMLDPDSGAGYRATNFINTVSFITNISALRNIRFDNATMLSNLNYFPTNGHITGFGINLDTAGILVAETNTNAMGLSEVILTNTVSEPFDTGEITAENRSIAFNPAGDGNKENIYDQYQYPVEINGTNVRITNWSIDIYNYTTGGFKTNGNILYLTNVYSSLNEIDNEPEKKNGHFEVRFADYRAAIYKQFRMEYTNLTNGSAFNDEWDGKNENNGYVLPDGVAYSKIYTRDRAYNTSTKVTAIEIDNTKPFIEITSPLSNAMIIGLMDITGTIQDKHQKVFSLALSNGYEVYNIATDIEGAVENGLLGQFDTTGLSGAGFLYVSALDSVSNTNKTVIPINLNNSGDVVFRITGVSNTVLSSSGTMKVTFYHTNNCTVIAAIDGVELLNSVYNTSGSNELYYQPAGIAEGTNTIDFIAVYNGKPPVNRSVNFTVDNTPPDLAVYNPSNGKFVNGILDITGDVKDSHLSDYRLYLKNLDTSEISLLSSGSMEIISNQIGVYNTLGVNAASPMEGANGFELILSAADKAGNTNAVTRLFRVDNAKPFADIIAGNDRLTSRLNPANLMVAAQDANLEGLTLSWLSNMTDVSITNIFGLPPIYNGLLPWNTIQLNGEKQVRLTVFDRAGNTNSAEKLFVIDNIAPAISNLVFGGLQRKLAVKADLYDNDLVASYEIGIRKDGSYIVYWNKNISSGTVNVDHEGDLTGLSNGGTAEMIFTAVDKAGNTTVTNIPFTVDIEAPFVRMEQPESNAVVGGNLRITGVIMDDHALSYAVLVDGRQVLIGAAPLASNWIDVIVNTLTSGISDGEHTISLLAVDEAGNEFADYRKIIIDNTPPLVALRTGRGNAIDGGTIEFYVTVRDNNPDRFEIARGGSGIISENLEAEYVDRFAGNVDTLAGNLNGLTAFTLTGYDKAGNVSSNSVLLDLDNIAPSIIVEGIDGGNILDDNKVKGAVTLRFRILDAHGVDYTVASVSETVTGSAYTNDQLSAVINSDILGEGETALKFSLVDEAGNIKEMATNLYVDRTAPAITVNASHKFYSPLANEGNNIVLAISSDEKVKADLYAVTTNMLGEKEYYPVANGLIFSGSTNYNWNGLINGQPLQEGVYTFRLEAFDSVSNTSAAESGSVIYIQDSLPPQLTITSLKKELSPGKTMGQLVYQVYNPADFTNLTIQTVVLDNNGMPFVLYNVTNKPGETSVVWNGMISNGFAYNDGNYPAQLKVTDFSGNSAVYDFEFIVDSVPPVISNVTLSETRISRNNPSRNNSIVSAVYCDETGLDFGTYQSQIYDYVCDNKTNQAYGSISMTEQFIFSNAASGTYELLFGAMDKAGNETVYTTNIIVDSSAPYVKLITNGNIYIRSDVDSITTNMLTNQIVTNGGIYYEITEQVITNYRYYQPAYASTNAGFRFYSEDKDLTSMVSAFAPKDGSLIFTPYDSNTVIGMAGLTNGLYWLGAAASDDIGNWSTNMIEFFVDGLGPVMDLEYTSNAQEPAFINGEMYITFTNRMTINSWDDCGIADVVLTISNRDTGESVITNYTGNFTNHVPFTLDQYGFVERGRYDIIVRAMDNLSNTGSLTETVSAPLGDLTPPVSELALSGNYTWASNVVHMNSNVAMTITATDIQGTGDGFVSGLKEIQYSINNGIWTNYTSALRMVNNGNYAFRFRAIDNAGNIEEAHLVMLIVSNDPPVISAFRSLVVDKTNILYEWTGSGNAHYRFTIGNTNIALAENYFLLSNIVLTSAPLVLPVSVNAIDAFGVDSAQLYLTNVLDQTLIVNTPPVGLSNNYQTVIPFSADFDTRIRNRKAVSYAPLDPAARLTIPSNWLSVYDSGNYNNKDKVKLTIPFKGKLTDGKYLVKAEYTDIYSNYRQDARTAVVDNTKPLLDMMAGGNVITNLVNTAVEGDLLVLTAADPMKNGVASGIRNIWYGLVHIDSEKHKEIKKNKMNVLKYLDFDYGKYETPVVLKEGYYLVAAKAEDRAMDPFDGHHGVWNGNFSETKIALIEVKGSENSNGDQTNIPQPPVVDHIPPFISISGATNGGYYNHTLAMNVTVTDANLAGKTVKLNGQTIPAGPFNVSSFGPQVLTVKAWDSAHNTNFAEISFTIDTLMPDITVTGLDKFEYRNEAEFSYSVEDDYPDWDDTKLNGSVLTTNALKLTNAGNYTLVISAGDKAGNTAQVTKTFRIVTVDAEPPVITITGVTNNRYYNSNITAVITVEDDNLDVSNTTVSMDGMNYSLSNGTVELHITREGKHEIGVYAVDTYGNIANAAKTFWIDRTSPLISIDHPADKHRYLKVLPVIRTQDNISNQVTVETYLQKKNGLNLLYTNWTITNAGDYTLVVNAWDEAGNFTNRSVTFSIVADLEDTLSLYAGFNNHDYAELPYLTGNNKTYNLTNTPTYVVGSSGKAIKTHYSKSPGVVYNASKNILLNPYRATMTFAAMDTYPFYLYPAGWDAGSFDHPMTLFELRNENGSMIKLYHSANNGLSLSIGGTNVTEIKPVNGGLTKCIPIIPWIKIKVVYDLIPAGGYPYLKIYGDDVLIKSYRLDGVLPFLPLSNGKLYFGFGPNDGFNKDEYNYLDELKIYDDVK